MTGKGPSTGSRFTKGLRDPETQKVSGRRIWVRFRGAFAILLSLAVLGGGGTYVHAYASQWWVSYTTSTDYTGAGTDDVQVTIPTGSTPAQISGILVSAGVVKTAQAFDQVVTQAGNPTIDAGQYQLKLQLPAQMALDMLLDPANVVRDRVTLPEGAWLTDEITTMAKATGLPASGFQKLLNKVTDPASLGLPAWFPKNASAEGYVFPDTYVLPDAPTAATMASQATTRFGEVAQKVDLEGRAAALSSQLGLVLKPSDLVIVASIVQQEANQPGDDAKLAQVIYNRLKLGMPLDMKSTVAYAVKKSAAMVITATDLNVKSPYNTHLNKGLPPGPIGSPGEAALTAAANPSGDTDILYYTVVDPVSGAAQFCSDSTCQAQADDRYHAWCGANPANQKLCG